MKRTRYIFIFCLIALFFYACQPSNPKQETVPQDNNDTFIDSAVSRTQDSMMMPNTYELQLKSGLDYKLQNLSIALNGVKSSADVATVYAQALSIQSILNECIGLQFEKEKILKRESLKALFTMSCDTFAAKTKLFKFTYVAEETEPYFVIAKDAFLKLSKSTKQKDDDAFFNLMIETYGAEGNKEISFPIWMTQTTDYSGYMKLGDYTVTKILTSIAAQETAGTSFKSQLTSLYADLINDILSYSKFGKSKSQVLAELEKVLAGAPMITDEDHDRISQRIADLKTGIKDKQIEYDCEHGNCHYE